MFQPLLYITMHKIYMFNINQLKMYDYDYDLK